MEQIRQEKISNLPGICSAPCAGGELYPGDPYFELDGRAVCEDCLARYARQYFAPQLRRVRKTGRSRAVI